MNLIYLLIILTLVAKVTANEAPITSKTEYEQAIAYMSGDGVARDSSKAFDLFLQCAHRGDPKAEYKVGVAYFNGDGVLKDQVEGLAWMYKAVGAGVSRAICTSMEEAIGAEMRLKARHRARELGFGNPSLFDTSHGHTNEDFLPSLVATPKPRNSANQNGIYDTDFQWMQKKMSDLGISSPEKPSALPSDPRILNRIGVQYEKGDKIAKNLEAAAEYYRQAAAQSYPLAQFNLARLYKDGKGVSKSSKTAFSLFYKAASTGHVSSQNQLGVAYALGNGVPKNLVRAYMWFNIAAANGSETAANNRDLAAQQMTPYQIQEAQRLSSEWTPQQQANP
jgi:TPR repeat protein